MLLFHLRTLMLFNNNAASFGGEIYSYSNYFITFQGDTSVAFKNNVANFAAGVGYIGGYSLIAFKNNSTVVFTISNVGHIGGCIIVRILTSLLEEIVLYYSVVIVLRKEGHSHRFCRKFYHCNPVVVIYT